MSEEKSATEIFNRVCGLPHVKQAIFFLNAYWSEHKVDADQVYLYAQKFIELDPRRSDGHDLDEFHSHRFLEHFGETLTVIELRNRLRQIDTNADGKMSLIEYLIDKFHRSVEDLTSRPQGFAQALEDAQNALDEVQKEIDAIESRKAALETQSQGSGVQARRAFAELSQLLSQDNTALNAKIITAEAAVRRAQRAEMVETGASWWMGKEMEELKKYKPKGNLRHSWKGDGTPMASPTAN